MPRNRADAVVRAFLSDPSVAALSPGQSVAVALSGGPDSMALLWLLAHQTSVETVQALTVDHGLRKESAREARAVGQWVKGWPRVQHHILKWPGGKPQTGIMEKARAARYDLLTAWCGKREINQLWLGHNQTDQAETFLFRLAKGSGLDGLAGMAGAQGYRETGLLLARPLIGVSKADLRGFCEAREIPFVDDPTNADMRYARARLRKALPVLEEEGLSEKRLAVTAGRLARAREALVFYTEQALDAALRVGRRDQTVLDLEMMAGCPAEIRLRMVRTVLGRMGVDGYGPRLESLEDRLERSFADLSAAKRFTLGGFLFSFDRRGGAFRIARES